MASNRSRIGSPDAEWSSPYELYRWLTAIDPQALSLETKQQIKKPKKTPYTRPDAPQHRIRETQPILPYSIATAAKAVAPATAIPPEMPAPLPLLPLWLFVDLQRFSAYHITVTDSFHAESIQYIDWIRHLRAIPPAVHSEGPREFTHHMFHFHMSPESKMFATVRVDAEGPHAVGCELVSIEAVEGLRGPALMQTVHQFIDALVGKPKAILFDDAHITVANPETHENTKMRLILSRAFSLQYPASDFLGHTRTPHIADIENHASWYAPLGWRPLDWAKDWHGGEKFKVFYGLRPEQETPLEVVQMPGEFSEAFHAIAQTKPDALRDMLMLKTTDAEQQRASQHAIKIVSEASRAVPDAFGPPIQTLGHLIAFHLHAGRGHIDGIVNPTSTWHAAQLINTVVEHVGVSQWAVANRRTMKQLKTFCGYSETLSELRLFVRDAV